MMLRLENIHFVVDVAGKKSSIFTGTTQSIVTGHHALLFEDPNHRKHVVDLLCGTHVPSRGRVLRVGRTSWAIGRGSFLRGAMRGVDIVGLICRAYDLDRAHTEAFLNNILTYPHLIHRPLSDWPPEARIELEFALALCPDFAIYVTDGNLHRIRTAFGAVWLELFRQRTAGRGLIVAGLSVASMIEFCNSAFVVRNRSIEFHEHLESALREFPPRAPDFAVGASEREGDSEIDEF